MKRGANCPAARSGLASLSPAASARLAGSRKESKARAIRRIIACLRGRYGSCCGNARAPRGLQSMVQFSGTCSRSMNAGFGGNLLHAAEGNPVLLLEEQRMLAPVQLDRRSYPVISQTDIGRQMQGLRIAPDAVAEPAEARRLVFP